MYYNQINLLVVSCFLLEGATALYFHLAEGERKCFIEEVPSDTMVTSNTSVNFIRIKCIAYHILIQFQRITKLNCTIHGRADLHLHR